VTKFSISPKSKVLKQRLSFGRTQVNVIYPLKTKTKKRENFYEQKNQKKRKEKKKIQNKIKRTQN